MDQHIQINKKSATTNNLYQSTFMPIFQKAETKIKVLILTAFFLMTPKHVLIAQIAGIILSVKQQVPNDLKDKDSYIKGLKRTSEFYIRTFYDPMKRNFETVQKKYTVAKKETPKTPKDLSLWSKRKGAPNVTAYEKELKLKLDELAKTPMLTDETGKKPISLWQKTELDVRYEHQLDMISKLKGEGVELAYISSHPNCSKRCEAFQGKLVSLTKRAAAPQTSVDKKFHYDTTSFIVGKENGRNVYSLTDIMQVTDSYGYNNNIICGFNCRHRLIPFHGQIAPEHYSKEDVAKERKNEERIRNMEREIRFQKTRAELYEKIDEKKISSAIMNNVNGMTDMYKKYCEKNGYAWYEYRINIL